jgi:hypothetical protein
MSPAIMHMQANFFSPRQKAPKAIIRKRLWRNMPQHRYAFYACYAAITAVAALRSRPHLAPSFKTVATANWLHLSR